MRAIFVYVAVAYGLSIAISLFIGATGGHDSAYVGFAIVSMLFPAVAVLTVRVTMGERVRSMGWGRFPVAYLPVALLLIPITLHAVMLPLLSLFLHGELPWRDRLGVAGLGAGAIALRFALNAGVGLLIVSVLAVFEEIGWRAWLLPRLVERIGARRAIVATAVLWAFWHTPFAFSGIHYLEGVSPIQTALIMPIGHIGAGLIIGWLWLRTESIWMVALAHGALNNWGQYAFKFMGGDSSHDAALLFTGNLGVLLVGALMLVFLKSRESG